MSKYGEQIEASKLEIDDRFCMKMNVRESFRVVEVNSKIWYVPSSMPNSSNQIGYKTLPKNKLVFFLRKGEKSVSLNT